MRDPARKIMTLSQAEHWWREARQRPGNVDLVATNGCFDLLHPGHVSMLWRARNLGDALIVLLNGDASVRELKGPGRPINPEQHRAYVLAGLASVSAVVVFGAARCDRELAALAPDVYVKAGDYTLDTLDPGERAALEACGARIEFVPLVADCSSSAILARQQETIPCSVS